MSSFDIDSVLGEIGITPVEEPVRKAQPPKPKTPKKKEKKETMITRIERMREEEGENVGDFFNRIEEDRRIAEGLEKLEKSVKKRRNAKLTEFFKGVSKKLKEKKKLNTRPDGKRDDRHAFYAMKDVLNKWYKQETEKHRPYKYRNSNKPIPHYLLKEHPEWDPPLKDIPPPKDYFVKELDEYLTPTQLETIGKEEPDEYLVDILAKDHLLSPEFYEQLLKLYNEWRKSKSLPEVSVVFPPLPTDE